MRLGMEKKSSLILLTLIWLSSLLGQFARLPSPWGTISWYEGFMAVFTGVAILTTLFTKSVRKKGPEKPLSSTKVLLIVWFFYLLSATLLQSISTREIGLAYLLRIGLYCVFGWSVFQALCLKWIDGVIVKQGVFFWLLFQALLGLGQYLWFPDTRWLQYLGWDDHFGRAFGTLLEPGLFGLFMSIGLVWSSQQLLIVKRWRETLLKSISWVVFLLALTTSFSRSALLSAIAGLLCLWLVSKKALGGFLLGMTLFAWLLIPQAGGAEGQNLLRTASIDARETVLRREMSELSLRQIVFGGWYIPASAQGHAQMLDSGWLQLLLSSGLVGTLLLLIGVNTYKKTLQKLLISPYFWIISTASLVSPGFLFSYIMLAGVVMSATYFVGD